MEYYSAAALRILAILDNAKAGEVWDIPALSQDKRLRLSAPSVTEVQMAVRSLVAAREIFAKGGSFFASQGGSVLFN